MARINYTQELLALKADMKYIKKAVQIIAVVLFGHLGITAVPTVLAW